MKVEGRIIHFDDVRGDGLFRSEIGEEFYFHCVVIANGTRTIESGVRARAQRHVGHRGHDEVVDVEMLTSP